MTWKIRYKLWKFKRLLSPSNEFKSLLAKKLDNAWNEKFHVKISWYQVPAFQRAFAFTAAVVIVASLGTGAFAYSSPYVTESHPLYFVKQRIENIEEKMNKSPEAKARFYLKSIERKEKEGKVLKSQGKQIEKIETIIEKTEEKLEHTQQILEEKHIKNPALQQQIKKRLELRAQRRAERLQSIIDKMNAARNQTSTEFGR